ncbi:hypothetical protein ACFQY4_18255 [Catellatospora bangladeshensis]|uniref:TrbL/VirB6 plasmid conjugal transfer protein n=1 Tax=Catellatospora bangladeshensis TaxID=310355 RepID=A0A8J3JJV8_9ACTN|nr:hypothetical protein [Catellatospora bangladeshensis]GIF82043.1 hypothetical protein Cba03nite_33920 [Catellatospora bangladeshensis]
MSAIAGQMIGAFIAWLATNVDNTLNTMWDLLSNALLRSPDVTALPQVKEFASTSLTVVNAAYILAVLATALMIMGRDTIMTQSPYGPGELIPRLIIGLIGANSALPLTSLIIRGANSVTAALAERPIADQQTLPYLRQLVSSALPQAGTGSIGTSPSPNAFLLVLIGLLIAVLLAILLAQWITRLGLLLVLAGISPVALALHGTPWTEPAAKLWWRSVLATLGTVTVQALCLHLAMRILLTPADNLPMLGIPGDPGAVLNLMVAACILIGVIKIPGLMKRLVLRGGSSGGRVIGFLVLQQATRIITGRLPGFGRRAPLAAIGARSGSSGGGGWPRIEMASEPATPGRAPWRGRPSWQSDPSGSSRPGGLAGPAGRAARRSPATAAQPARARPKPYTADELAAGVDLYTRRMKKPRGTI